LNLWLIWF